VKPVTESGGQQLTLPMSVDLRSWQNERMVRRYAHLSVSHLAEHAAMMDRVLDPGMASRNRSEGQSFLTATGS
jgi:hypothetical protein